MLSEPTHAILDRIWAQIPRLDGFEGPPNAVEEPNVLDRLPEMLRVMLLLHECGRTQLTDSAAGMIGGARFLFDSGFS